MSDQPTVLFESCAPLSELEAESSVAMAAAILLAMDVQSITLPMTGEKADGCNKLLATQYIRVRVTSCNGEKAMLIAIEDDPEAEDAE